MFFAPPILPDYICICVTTLPAAGQDELHRYCTRERRSFVEVLRDFPSVRVPLPRLLELVPRIAPRYFSIASSPIAQRSPANQVRGGRRCRQ